MHIDPLIILGITSGATEQISNLSTGTIKVKRVENEQSLLMAYAYVSSLFTMERTWCHFIVWSVQFNGILLFIAKVY